MNAVVDSKFFPKAPKELLAAKEFSAIPYLLGVNNHEYGWNVFVVRYLLFSSVLQVPALSSKGTWGLNHMS